MCGRFSRAYTWAEIHALSRPLSLPASTGNLRPRYNIALATKMDMIVRTPDALPQAPPNNGERVMAWFQRIRPLIDGYNVRQDEAAREARR